MTLDEALDVMRTTGDGVRLAATGHSLEDPVVPMVFIRPTRRAGHFHLCAVLEQCTVADDSAHGVRWQDVPNFLQAMVGDPARLDWDLGPCEPLSDARHRSEFDACVGPESGGPLGAMLRVFVHEGAVLDVAATALIR